MRPEERRIILTIRESENSIRMPDRQRLTYLDDNNFVHLKRGDVYARKEVTNPTRIVTSTVKVIGGKADMVSVKTKEDIPKEKIFDCVKLLKGVEVKAPVHIGDVIVPDAAGTGIDIVATKNVEKE